MKKCSNSFPESTICVFDGKWVLVKLVEQPGPGSTGISLLKTGLLYITSKYMFVLTDNHAHDSEYLNVYLQTICNWNQTLDVVVNITDCFLGWYWITVGSPVLTFICFKAVFSIILNNNVSIIQRIYLELW